MMRRIGRISLAGLIATVVGVAGVQMITASGAQAGPVLQRVMGAMIDPLTGKMLYWDECWDGRSEAIWLEEYNNVCGPYPGGENTVRGYAKMTTKSSTSHTVEVCAYQGTAFYMTIAPQNADGSSGNPIDYPSRPGQPCYVAVKGYKIQKFTAKWSANNGTYPLPGWVAPRI